MPVLITFGAAAARGLGFAARRAPPVLTYRSSDYNKTDASFMTLSNQAIGSAASDRYIVVCVSARYLSSTATDPTITVAGQACSAVVSHSSVGGSNFIINVIYVTDAPVTTGTTATVVVTAVGGETLTRAFISTYSLTGATSNTPTRTDGGTASAADTSGVTLTSSKSTSEVELVVCTGSSSGSGTPTITGSGVLTYDFSSIDQDNGAHRSGKTTGPGSYTTTVTATGFTAGTRTSSAVWT